MQKSILITSILGMFLSTACETSHKGKWSNSDKELARKQMTEACNNDYFSDSALKQQYIDCYLKKLEINFNSFSESAKDSITRYKLATDCMHDYNNNISIENDYSAPLKNEDKSANTNINSN